MRDARDLSIQATEQEGIVFNLIFLTSINIFEYIAISASKLLPLALSITIERLKFYQDGRH